jgi:hypothetical protein
VPRSANLPPRGREPPTKRESGLMFLRAALLASAVSLFYAHVAAAAPLM